MSTFQVYVDEFDKDGWKEFVDYYRTEWDLLSDEDKERYKSVFGDEEIAIVTTSKMGERAVEWFSDRIGALDQKSAQEVLKRERHGASIVKAVLMRMH